MQRNCGRILVVDDEKAIREVMSSILSSMGFEVEVASDGQDGLHIFLERPFDLVMTDLRMPGIDGWTLAHYIKDKSLDTPVIVVTGEDKMDLTEMLKESCIDYAIFKPFFLEDIEEAVEKVSKARKIKKTDTVVNEGC